jgi:hypothetical protein
MRTLLVVLLIIGWVGFATVTKHCRQLRQLINWEVETMVEREALAMQHVEKNFERKRG